MQIYSAMIPVKETFSKKEFVRLLLEWNQGSHFKEPDIRTAKAFAWVLTEKERMEQGIIYNPNVSELTDE